MSYGYLNMASLLLGLVAWAVPCVCLVLRLPKQKTAPLCMGSLAACAISLLCQILYTDHLVQIGDWSALLDTSRAVVWAASLLLAVAVLLNSRAWHLAGERK